MPADRTLAADLADRLVSIYGSAEVELAKGIAKRLAAGVDAPEWATEKLAAAGELRRWAQRLTAQLGAESSDVVAQQLVLAFERGGVEAMGELARAGGGPRIAERLARVERALPGGQAVARLARSLVTRLAGTHVPIVRWAVDAYREVIAVDATPAVLLGLQTRREASQQAWGKLLRQGVKGFVDRSGRQWSLAGYVEMATRSAVAQASIEGHLDRLAAAGLDLVIVSDAAQECERCRPWEGKVLARDGAGVRGPGTVDAEHATEDRIVSVRVAGTVDEAVRAGLLHPNCRHSLNAYLPGLTVAPKGTADPEGDKARQRLRALERDVRASRLQAAAALTPEAKRDAELQARAGQAKIKAHVDATAHLGIFRKPERERLNLGNANGGA